MNIHVNFLDGYYDSGARVADMDRIAYDAEYRRGYRQRIVDDREREMEEWQAEPAHSDHIYSADHRNRVDSFVCVTDDPTIGELMAMHEANNYADEPGYTASWMTY